MTTTQLTGGTELREQAETAAGVAQWDSAWRGALPVLALVGPAAWFLAALIRAAGIGVLDGDLDWVSRPEGLVMFLGSPFLVATFVFMGRQIAGHAPRSGIWITALGVLGVAALTAISAFRLFVGQFTDAGMDPDELNEAFETLSIWDVGWVLNFGQFAAWLVAGIAVLTTRCAPRWVGACFVGGVVAVIAAQGAYVALEVLWPVGTGLYLLGVAGLVASTSD